jgi:hypothetical protein
LWLAVVQSANATTPSPPDLVAIVGTVRPVIQPWGHPHVDTFPRFPPKDIRFRHPLVAVHDKYSLPVLKHNLSPPFVIKRLRD